MILYVIDGSCAIGEAASPGGVSCDVVLGDVRVAREYLAAWPEAYTRESAASQLAVWATEAGGTPDVGSLREALAAGTVADLYRALTVTGPGDP